MRTWLNLAASCLVALPAALATIASPHPVRADDAPLAADVATTADAAAGAPARQPQHIGYGAMPGGLHVASAESPLPGTVELGLVSGFGYRGKLLGADHAMSRAIGEIAASYTALPGLVLGLSLDGRYDRHTGLASKTDDNYVGDPHLLARYVRTLGELSLGAQLGIWLPGKKFPSIVPSATSVDARALASYDAGPAVVTVDAGFRFDNSANSVDDPQSLSLADRVSLGASGHSAVLAGVAVRAPLARRLYASVEGSTEQFVGSGAPRGIYRGGAMVGVTVNDALSVVGYAEAAKVPPVRYRDAMRTDLVLVPYEPTITGGVALQARFGGPRGATSQIVKNARPAPVTVIETAELTGSVVDDVGRPVVGARVTVKLKNHTGTAISDDKGAYSVAELPIGKTVDGKTELDDTGAEIAVEVASKKPGTTTLTLARGANTAPRIALDPVLPPGQLRAVIINVATSRPIAGATVTIEPGEITATSGPDGKFTVDLAPGHYRITVTAKGLAQQQLDVNIDPNGVAIKNIDMHR